MRRVSGVKNGFTLIEILIVLVIISVMAGLAIPMYTSSINDGRARDVLVQLAIIHAANEIYEANAGEYLSDGGGELDEEEINSGLDINLVFENMSYRYTEDGGGYEVLVYWSGASPFTIGLNETFLGSTNPCCFCGTCPSVIENNCTTMCP